MADGYDLVRRLGMAAVRMDGAYYMCAKKFGVKENMLALHASRPSFPRAGSLSISAQ